MTYTEVRDLDRSRAVPILPVGAMEAHGPHLPLATDVIISEAMAREGARLLAGRGWTPVLLPSLAYTPARFAQAFPGTLSLRPETLTATLLDVAGSLAAHGFQRLVVANSHLDPDNLKALYAALEAAPLAIIFPDITRKPWALRMTDEFKSGACHAGRYEGSVVMASAPASVRESVRQALPANPASLSVAIRNGVSSFEEAGGPQAYFGDPAAASAREGEEIIAVMGAILAEAVEGGAA